MLYKSCSSAFTERSRYLFLPMYEIPVVWMSVSSRSGSSRGTSNNSCKQIIGNTTVLTASSDIPRSSKYLLYTSGFIILEFVAVNFSGFRIDISRWRLLTPDHQSLPALKFLKPYPIPSVFQSMSVFEKACPSVRQTPLLAAVSTAFTIFIFMSIGMSGGRPVFTNT